ncbi:MAG: sugar ABC transporter permease [Acidobacteriia bacterium]|nr:sugar ABC transporter permease [Terriglobia bacterium]
MRLAFGDLGNFTRLISDRTFGIATVQTIVLTAVALAAEFVLGLALALLVDSLSRAKSIFRAGLLVPMLLPPVVAAVAWRLIYNPQFGVLNGTLRQLGVNTSALTWTNGHNSALLSVIVVDIWEWTPFLFLLLSAGLQAIPPDPIEAARIDGAGPWRLFRDVTLPLLKPTILLALLLRAMDLVRIFDQIFILTQGGPGTATETVSLYIYRTAFRFSNFGYAAAMSFVLLAATMLFSRGLMRVMRAR